MPHYSTHERAAHALGQDLSRAVQERAAAESATIELTAAACPACGRKQPVNTRKRTVLSLDGPVELLEQTAHCPACRRDFFPQRERLGLNARECTPETVRVAVHLAAEIRSFQYKFILTKSQTLD